MNGDLLYTDPYKTEILVQEDEKEVEEEERDVHIPLSDNHIKMFRGLKPWFLRTTQ